MARPMAFSASCRAGQLQSPVTADTRSCVKPTASRPALSMSPRPGGGGTPGHSRSSSPEACQPAAGGAAAVHAVHGGELAFHVAVHQISRLVQL